jgi:hypothetical protein
LFRYVVHYSDGKTVEVPVRYDRGVGHWLGAIPKGLPEATVAWAAPLPKESQRQAIVYQMSWTNPRPEQEIRSVDVRVADGTNYGVPIVFGITAGSARDGAATTAGIKSK